MRVRSRVEDELDVVRVADPVRLAGVVVAAAVVEERRHVLGRALEVAQADLDGVLGRLRLALGHLEPLGRDQVLELDVLLPPTRISCPQQSIAVPGSTIT